MQEHGPALLASVVFFTAVLGIAEIARRRFAVAADVTRKLALAAMGAWSVPGVHLFADSRDAAIPFAVLAFVLWVSFRWELLAGIEDDGAGLGSVLAPASAAALLGLFPPELSYLAVSGILAMALGDSTAALLGRRWGTRRYRVHGHARTMEGTLALFLSASAASALALAMLGGLDPHQAVAFGLIAGTLAAVAETISIYGTDNASVPVTTALTLFVLVRVSGAQ